LTIAIVTDSTAYFTEQEKKIYDPVIVPLTVSIGEDVFQEGTKYSNADFYALIRQSEYFPASSQPPVGEFVDVYKRLLENYDEIISIHLSGALSGTVQSARNASEIADNEKRITIIDSLSVAQGISAMVIQASKMACDGQSRAEICKSIDYMVKHTQIFFLIDTLEYLQKGGRIGGAAALLANLLQIKPILYLQAGKVELLEKIRTEKKAVQYFVDLAAYKICEIESSKLQVRICHADNYSKALELQNLLSTKISGIKTDMGELGPVIGMHGGPGTCGVILSQAE
jgi:DegV family protein with EDD domain